jgi:formylmethanofuran dehydrogenase subunit E
MPDFCYDYRYERPLAKAVDTCNICGEDIYEGESYYDIENIIICNSCIEEFKKVAQEE